MQQELAQGHTPREELANAATHGLGAALSVAALCFMVVQASFGGDVYRIVSVSVFGASMVLLYVFSTLYHSFQAPRVKNVFRRLDHCCIYLLIAGTYTPFTLISIRGGWGWSLFGVVWGLAFCGIVFKTFFLGRFKVVSVLVYLGMGWLAVFALGPIVSALPGAGLFWLVAGGLMYTLGVLFYIWRGLRYHHAVWHLFVLGGTTCHFLSVFLYVLPVAR